MTVDADQLFAVTASSLMAEMGLDYDRYTQDEMHQLFEAVAAQSDSCWEDFMLWVVCGDDKRERTKLRIKAQMLKAQMSRGLI